MKYRRAIRAFVGLFIAASPAFSQSDACPGGGAAGGGNFSRTEAVFTYNFPVTRIIFPGITGQPYSWQTTSQTGRTLANGTRVTQTPPSLSPMYYRDSMGRTRTDSRITKQLGPNAGQVSRPYEIDDPVAGYRYIIDDFHQIAHRIAACTPTPQAIQTVLHATPGPGSPARPGGTVTTEDLGTQTMQGVAVTGRRQTITFAPGAYHGNDAPVTSVQETWHSTQFGLDFLTKISKPEGQVTMQIMTTFTAGEPDPALFQPPPGYQIVDETAQFSITIPFK